MNIKNSTFLITGGSSGIGKAIAKLIIEKEGGAAITGRNEPKLRKATEEIGAHAIQADVSDPEDIKKTYRKYFKKFEKLDCLINNAGIGGGSELTGLTSEMFLEVYSTNVFGAALMAKEAAKIFKEQKYGNIINIGSTSGNKGYEGGTVYASSKFALKGMTMCWQAELRKYNVRVMLINPSEVRTEFFKDGRKEEPNKLRGVEIAHTVAVALEMDDRGFIPELMVWATNPW